MSAKQNEVEIRKSMEALDSSDFAANGALNPEQLKKFISRVRDNSCALEAIRFEQLKNPRKNLDSMVIGEPVSELATENTAPAAGNA